MPKDSAYKLTKKYKAVSTLQLNHAGFAAVRVSTLPFSEVVDIVDDNVEVGQPIGYDKRLANEIHKLERLLEKGVVSAAIRVASPSLLQRLSNGLSIANDGFKTILAAHRYVSRMGSRCTPFGLFAGVAACRIEADGAPSGQYSYMKISDPRITSRIDYSYLHALAIKLSKSGVIQNQRYTTNSSLYRLGNVIRYAERFPSTSGIRYQLSEFPAGEHVLGVIDFANTGRTQDEFVEYLLAFDADLERAEAQSFVSELISSDVLVSEIEAPIVTADPAAALQKVLMGLMRQNEITVDLSDTLHFLNLPTNIEISNLNDHLDLVVEKLKKAGLPDNGGKNTVQIDVSYTSTSLHESIVEEVCAATRLLLAIGPVSHNPILADFTRRFAERFEAAEVPLAEALDEDFGVALTEDTNEITPFLHGVNLQPNLQARKELGSTPFDRALWDAVASRSKGEVIALETLEPFLSIIEGSRKIQSQSVSSMFRLVREPTSDEDNDVLIDLTGVFGATPATAMLGRFCNNDARLLDFVKKFSSVEQSLEESAILAEVVHLPQGRVGNVLCRPSLRNHHICYLGSVDDATDSVAIPISDLMLSVWNGTVFLRSKSLNKVILPRLTSAHNYLADGNLPIYRFLCLLQQQNSNSIGTFWGSRFDFFAYLPRLQLGSVIVQKATWRISGDEIAGLKPINPIETFEKIQVLRSKLQLPKLISFSEGDNMLLADLDSVLSCCNLADALAGKQGGASIQEYLAPSGRVKLESHGSFRTVANEFILPLLPTAHNFPKNHQLEDVVSDEVRLRPPSSDWVYFKIYTGIAAAEKILFGEIAEAIGVLCNEGHVNKWFFIRYKDVASHLRLRLTGSNMSALESIVIPKLNCVLSKLLYDKRIARFSLDTYVREIERYGGVLGMPHVETLFWVDSVCVTQLLSRGKVSAPLSQRWKMGILCTLQWLDDFALNLDDKTKLCALMIEGQGRRFRRDGSYKKAIGDKFRKMKDEMHKLISEETGDAVATEIKAALSAKSINARNACDQIRCLDIQRQQFFLIVTSIVHMSLNRIFHASANAQEQLVYELLSRYLKGLSEQQKDRMKQQKEGA